jgi:hypothetical protein
MGFISAQWRTQSNAVLRLGGPLIVNYLAVAGMGLADTIMSGRLGAESLAAVAVGNSSWMLAFSACLGILMAISPIVSRHFGAGEIKKIGRYARHGMYLGFAMGLDGRVHQGTTVWCTGNPDVHRITIHDRGRGLHEAYHVYVGLLPCL